jgi:hypothetical protein
LVGSHCGCDYIGSKHNITVNKFQRHAPSGKRPFFISISNWRRLRLFSSC